MIEQGLIQLFMYILGFGVVGSFVGGITGVLSKDERLHLGVSTGVGFLVGAAAGALIGIFANLTGR